MKYEFDVKPAFLDLNFEIRTQGSIREILERTEEHLQQLNSQFPDNSNTRILSPSAINTWLNCRMKFYYRYVNRLREPEKVTADIDPAMLGNILHEIMKSIYQSYRGQVLTGEILNSIVRNKQHLAGIINEAINEKFRDGSDNPVSGNELIVRDVLMAYVVRILEADKTFTPFTILNLEETFSFRMNADPSGSQIEVLVGGKIDRIDVVDGVTRIVGYKTGTVAEFIKSPGDLFADDRKKDSDGWLQTLLYCEAYLANTPGKIVRPSVYMIKKLAGGITSDKLRVKSDNKSETVINDYNLIRNDFMIGLKGLINIIFSNDEPFTMTKDIRGKCSYCPYRNLCMR